MCHELDIVRTLKLRWPDFATALENTWGVEDSHTAKQMSSMESVGMADGYRKDTDNIMDKDELEELLGLQVQFGVTPSSSVATCKESGVGEGAKLNCWPGRKSDCQSQRVQVDIGGEAFRMWSDLGTAQGLGTDPEIAAFLLQHYENTKCCLIPSGSCTVCHQPLSLFCSQCKRPAQLLPLSAPPENGSRNKPNMPTRITQNHAAKVVEFSKARRKTKKIEEEEMESATPVGEIESHGDGDDHDDCGDDQDDDDIEDMVDNQTVSDSLNISVDGKEDVGDMTSSNQVRKVAKPHGDKSKKQIKESDKGGDGREEEKVFRCMMCNRTYTRACSLKAHMRKHTGEKPFKCKRCDAAFSLSGSLLVHLRTHTGDKPFVCEECGQKFYIANALKQHRRQHTGEKPYHCKICFSRYSRSDSLKVHMRTHSGDRPFICEICGADFSRLYCLIAHKKKHSGERPFKCSECPASFVQSGKLTIHMRKHTGDRPFQCEQCGASFTQSERLKTHLRIHSGEKPYKCGECGKGFSHPHSLKVHGRVHTGDKPYKCEVCSLTFADPSYFRRHKAKHTTTSELGMGTTGNSSDSPLSVAGYLDAAVADGFAAPPSGTENLNALQAAGIGLSSNAPTMITAGFSNANISTETLGSPDCFSDTAAGFSVPLTSSVPSPGFPVPSSVGLGFSGPSAMNVIADGTDAGPNIGAVDPFAFLRTALHCPGSYPS